MIHDIYPHKYDNAYKNININDKDYIVIFNKNNVLLKVDSDDKWKLPNLNDMNKCYDNDSYRYLFKIDDVSYYLIKDSIYFINNTMLFEKDIRQFRDEKNINQETKFAILTAWHLSTWYDNNRLCGRCGDELKHSVNMRMLYCTKCKQEIFPQIAPAVIIAVTDGDRILMSKYQGRHYKGYALLAGFVEIGETPEQTVEREVMEEVGLKVKNITYYKSQPGGIDGNLLLGFYCELEGNDTIIRDEEELAMAAWYRRDEIPVEDNNYSLTFEMIAKFKHNL